MKQKYFPLLLLHLTPLLTVWVQENTAIDHNSLDTKYILRLFVTPLVAWGFVVTALERLQTPMTQMFNYTSFRKIFEKHTYNYVKPTTLTMSCGLSARGFYKSIRLVKYDSP